MLLLLTVEASMISACSRNSNRGNVVEKLPNTVVLQWNEIITC
jgi:hypothetical protein